MFDTIPLYNLCSRILDYILRIYKKFTLESILIAIFALLMINNTSLFKIPLYQDGDIAANALLILRAKKFELLHGNYSRFGFYHPGPFFYYVYAIGEIVLFDYLHLVPKPSNSHIISALLLQFFFLYLSLTILNRIFNKNIHPLILIFFSLPFLRLIPYGWGNIWPPFMVIFPSITFLISLIAVMNKDISSIPILIFSTGVLIHFHVSMPIFVAPPLTILIFHYRKYDFTKLHLNLMNLLNIFLLNLFLLPFILDVLKLQNSNIFRIFVFIKDKPYSIHSITDTLYYFFSFFSFTDLYNFFQVPDGCKEACIELLKTRGIFILFWLFPIFSFIYLILKIPYFNNTKIKYFWKTSLGLIGLEFLLTLFWSLIQKDELFLYNTYIMYSFLFLLFFVCNTPIQIIITRILVKNRLLKVVVFGIIAVLILFTTIPQQQSVPANQVSNNYKSLMNFNPYNKQSITLLIDEPHWTDEITLFLFLKRAGKKVYFLEKNFQVNKTLELIFNPENRLPGNKYTSTSFWEIVTNSSKDTRPLTDDLSIRYLVYSDLEKI